VYKKIRLVLLNVIKRRCQVLVVNIQKLVKNPFLDVHFTLPLKNTFFLLVIHCNLSNFFSFQCETRGASMSTFEKIYHSAFKVK